jgi:hypothetical protein
MEVRVVVKFLMVFRTHAFSHRCRRPKSLAVNADGMEMMGVDE